jgi:hypothetical protein
MVERWSQGALEALLGALVVPPFTKRKNDKTKQDNSARLLFIRRQFNDQMRGVQYVTFAGFSSRDHNERRLKVRP